MNTNPAASLPHTAWVEEALGKLELLVVQDIFHPTETGQLAHILMPAAQWYEKEGTVITSERRVEYIPKVIDPPGQAWPDWKIMQAIAQRMGYGALLPYKCEEDIFNEWRVATIGKLCDMKGISYNRIRGKQGLQLPCPSEGHPGRGYSLICVFSDPMEGLPCCRANNRMQPRCPMQTSPSFY